LVQQEWQDDVVEQLAVQLLQGVLQPTLQDEPQLNRQGSRQLSERTPRRKDSSKQGRGQHLPYDGAGIGVQQDGAAQVGAAQVGAQVVHVGAGATHELQPPPLRAKMLKPTGLITE
jgi:hypothetical protein